ncbi:hypothetical protein CEXT_552901 [Caerostris extrusa]|uniref:Uncharacterized protein n=1 Tax=Caerostris extrusa TaxID=172846 RepID=A0AAV4N8X6_CAEEX|nr:hypothetical protein CEXT_552901 [Caerostris extrusa]
MPMLFPTRYITAESVMYLRTADIVICIGVQILIGSHGWCEGKIRNSRLHTAPFTESAVACRPACRFSFTYPTKSSASEGSIPGHCGWRENCRHVGMLHTSGFVVSARYLYKRRVLTKGLKMCGSSKYDYWETIYES